MFNSRALLVKFFCLVLLVSFANITNAVQSIRSKLIEPFQEINNVLKKSNYEEHNKAIKMLNELESQGGLNDLETVYIYHFKGIIALHRDDYEASQKWFKKIIDTNNDHIPKSFLLNAKKTLNIVQEIISTYQPNYIKHKHLLKKLGTTKKITDDHHTLAQAAFQLSKNSDAHLILQKVKNLHNNKTALPERWMLLEASLAETNEETLKLIKQIAQHYPSEENRQAFSIRLHKHALSAFKQSKLSESKSLLKEAEVFHRNDQILPERWMKFKTKLVENNKEKLELWKQIVEYYPSKKNQRDLAGWYSKNNQKQKAYEIYIKLYTQGKLTSRFELELAAHSFSRTAEYLKGALVLAKGFKEKTVPDSRDNLGSYESYFDEAKKDKTITAQEWLDAGDKFVLYGDKDKAKVCFKKAKKDKTLRDVAKQRLKALKKS